MTSSRMNRFFMMALAFIAITACAAFDAPKALAQSECCGFGVYNNTNCAFRVTLTTATFDSTYSIPVGGGSETIPDCAPFRLTVRDYCGNVIHLPTTIDSCVTVYFGPGCCAEICKISTCRWAANPIHCAPCL